MTYPDPEAPVATERGHPASSLDCATSVAVLVDTIATATADEQQHALLFLVRKSLDDQERTQMYKTNAIRVLSELVKTSDSYISQLYALKCLAWATSDESKLSPFVYDELRASIRESTSQELLSLLDVLRCGSEAEKDDGVVLCASIASCGQRDALRDVGVISPLIEMLKNGTALQKLWATKALEELARSNDENRVAIVREGVAPPLIALLRVGTDEQKQLAAYALGKIVDSNDENRTAVAHEGAISPLVTLLRAGTCKQKGFAAYALGKLADYNVANSTAIAREGAISPLVALVENGIDGQKE
ncbi:hypothetical protein BBJ28_00016202, partial [Nothophytophthora sp. Chile5]